MRPIIACLFCIVSASGQTLRIDALESGRHASDQLRPDRAQLRFARSQVATVLRERPRHIQLTLPRTVALPSSFVLDRFDVLTPDARVLIGNREVDLHGQFTAYRGTIPEVPRSFVVISVTRTRVTGLINLGNQRYTLASKASPQNDDIESDLLPLDNVLYNRSNDCGVDDRTSPMNSPALRGTETTPYRRKGVNDELQIFPVTPRLLRTNAAGSLSTDTIEVRIALEGDYQFVTKVGSAEDAIEHMLTTVALASAIYKSEIGVTLAVPFTRVWDTTANPYTPYNTNIFSSLAGLTDIWKSTMGGVERTIVHLFTSNTSWTSGFGVGGVANIDGLCSYERGYGVTSVSDTSHAPVVMTFAHEVGHNFGAYHTHSCLWPGGPIDKCTTVEGGCYSGPTEETTGTIMSYCSTRLLEFGSVVSGAMRRMAEIAACAPSVNAASVSIAEKSALDALYNSTGGGNWNNRTAWTSSNVDDRFGVAVRGGKVYALHLGANNLVGTIPASIADLAELRYLNLSGRDSYHLDAPGTIENGNQLQGSILTALLNMLKLEHVDLSNNAFTGTLSGAIGGLQQLRVLNLGSNQFSGSIPSQIGILDKLELFDIWRNQFSGPIPSTLGDLANLHTLDLSENYGLTGSIPVSFGALTALRRLGLNVNQLDGAIPAELGSLTQLEYLNLSNNMFSGAIPASLGGLTSLRSFSAGFNQISGSIPSELGSMSKLTDLTLGNNQLTGPIPPELAGIALWRLQLNDNLLTGPLPEAFGSATTIVEFEVQGNQLTGTIPESYAALGTDEGGLGGLISFRVGNNQLSGAIPPWIATKTTLGTLDLGGNDLDDGPVPSSFQSLTGLYRLFLHDMNLTDSIPSWIGSLPNLQELRLDGNALIGPLPASLGGLSNLRHLYLDHNQLDGPLPAELGGLSNLFYLRLSHNAFSGNVPASFNALTNLIECGLDSNDLESIPDLGVMPFLKVVPGSFATVNGNRLTFEDVAPYVGTGILQYTYAPQQEYGTATESSPPLGSEQILNAAIEGTGNVYTWYRNDDVIAGAEDSVYTITAFSVADTGTYAAVVTNASAPMLTLHRAPIRLTVELPALPSAVSLISPDNSAEDITLPLELVWHEVQGASGYIVEVDSSGTFSSPLFSDTTAAGTDTSVQVLALPHATTFHWRARGFNAGGEGPWSTVRTFQRATPATGVEDHSPTPFVFSLRGAYPNPFNPSTTIEYTVPSEGRTVLRVYDIFGRHVALLVDAIRAPGSIHRERFDASSLASGFYMARLEFNGSFETKRLLLLK